ncbi:MAG: hypothetical protein WD069_03360 [Planctomycetales bacterium]
MKDPRVIVWFGIVVCFLRGLFVFNMGPSAAMTYPTASGLCLAGSVIAAAIIVRRGSDDSSNR